MQRFNKMRITTGFTLAFLSGILFVMYILYGSLRHTDEVFTEEINRLHRSSLEKIKENRHFSTHDFKYPVFVYDKKDSLLFWSEEFFPYPDQAFTGKHSVLKIQGSNDQGLLFKNKCQNLVCYIYIPVVQRGHLNNELFNYYPAFNTAPHHRITYSNSIPFDLNALASPGHTRLISWIFLAIFLFSLWLISPVVNRISLKIVDNASENHEFPVSLFFAVVLVFLMDIFAVLPADWMTGSDLIPGDIMVSPFSMVMLAVFVIYLISHLSTVFSELKLKNRSKIVLIPLLFITISLAAGATIYLIQYIYLRSEININLDQLFNIQRKDIVLLGIIILIFIGFIGFIQWMYGLIQSARVGLAVKIYSTLLAIALLVVLIRSGWILTPVIPFILSFLILIIFLDLYHDRKKLNSGWIISWLVLISAFLSFLVFYTDYKKDKTERLEILKQSLFERNPDLENNILTYTDSLEFHQNTKIDSLLPDKFFWNSEISSFSAINDSLFFDPLSGNYWLVAISAEKDQISVRKFSNEPQFNTGADRNTSGQGDFQYNWTANAGEKHLITHYPAKDSIWISESWSYVSHTNASGYTAVNRNKMPNLLRPLALFAAMFFLMSFGLFVLSIINTRSKILPSGFDLAFFRKKSLRSRIQISILSLIIIAFLIIGFISFYYFKRIYDLQTQDLTLTAAKSIQTKYQSQIDQYLQKNPQEDIYKKLFKTNEFGSIPTLNIVNVQNTRLVPFNYSVTALPLLRIPYALTKKMESAVNSPVQPEWNNKNQGVFIPLYGGGSEIFYLFRPASGNKDSDERIADLLLTFPVLYTILFILSAIIAIGLSNSITNPIELLGKKLKDLKLSRKNETVDWQNEDEIGTLIGIYNEMIIKLGDNAKLMAKIERDSAWKEMAQQVAHEIKNPLTPLKLNIQYLEAKVSSNPEIAPHLIAQLAPSLIEQIDNLSQIASEFSNFAQLPDARNEKLNLNDIVKKVHDFFRKREDMRFQLVLPINDVLVFADKNHVVRILNNVIKNAIQAIPEDRPGEISIHLYRQGTNALIKVSDNGSGIPENMREKVFSPNFTTKSSGTGLGLAIAINMLESFGGRIYFETKENTGTDFFIEIPLMRFEDNFPQGKSVMLDD